MRTSLLADFEQFLDDRQSAMVSAVQDWIEQGCPGHYWMSPAKGDGHWRFIVQGNEQGPALYVQSRSYSGYAQMHFWSFQKPWDKTPMHPLKCLAQLLEEVELDRDASLVEDMP